MNGQNGTVENLEGKEVSVWKKPGTWIKIGVLVALVVIIAVGIAVFDWGDRLVDLLEWLKDHKVEGFFIFGGMYVLATGADILVEKPLHQCYRAKVMARVISIVFRFLFEKLDC